MQLFQTGLDIALALIFIQFRITIVTNSVIIHEKSP